MGVFRKFLVALAVAASSISTTSAAPVALRLVDDVSKAAITNTAIDAYELGASGEEIWRAKRTTDSNGDASFDLVGVEGGRAYVIRTSPYGTVLSTSVTAPGNLEIRAGKLQVTLISGRSGKAYSNQEVLFIERLPSGAHASVTRVRTDASGRLRLDPADLGARSYFIRATSLIDGTHRDSVLYTQGGNFEFAVGGAELIARVVDRVSEQSLASLMVNAYEKLPDGSLVWRSKRETDAEGVVRFDLDGLGSGKVYVLRTAPYGQAISSDELTTSAGYRFWVGKLQIRMVDGVTGRPLAGRAAVLHRWQADGNHVFLMNANADPDGWLKLDPPGMGIDRFILSAVSPSDSRSKFSDVLSDKGPHTFKLGNEALIAQLKDAQSGAPLSGKTVEAWERLADSRLVLRLQRQTDEAGAARFDLDGIGSGRRYMLRSQPYLQSIETAEITRAGIHVLQAGKLQVTLIAGRSNKPYGNQEAVLIERLANGTYGAAVRYRTDMEGKLRLDPEELGNRSYFIRANSLVDGTSRDSVTFNRAGSYEFVVGGAELTARVVDQVSNTNLPNLLVSAYEKLADGRLVWRAKQTTDAEGLVKFDLDGLGGGKVYVLRTEPFGQPVNSDELTTSTGYRFWVGKLQIRLIDGASGKPLPDKTVLLNRWQADGNHQFIMNVTSDAQGWLKLDPAGMGKDKFVLSAQSPTDGRSKFSEALSTKGPHTFLLGNEPLIASLKDAVSGAALANKMVEVWEKPNEGNPVLRDQRKTDGSGVVRFDLDGLGSGRRFILKSQPYLQAIETSDITQSGAQEIRAGKLQLTIVSGRSGKAMSNRDVQLVERLAGGAQGTATVFRTDAEGKLRLDPADLGIRAYFVRASSLVDGTMKESQAYSKAGNYTFTVGGGGVQLRLVDHATDTPLAGHEINAYEKKADDSLVWLAKRTSDAEGLVQLDLDGMGSGKKFVFTAKPYGFTARSDVISADGGYRLRAGTTPVKLSESSAGRIIAGVTLIAYEKRRDGTLRLDGQGVTDTKGVIPFDLERLGEGASYVIRAVNPFGDGNDHFSSVLISKGAFAFALKKDEAKHVDQTPPVLTLQEPGDMSPVSTGGVRILGTADDDEAIREVRITVVLPSGATIVKQATYRAATKAWSVHTGPLAGLPGKVQVRVVAVDRAWNETEATLDLNLVKDTQAPELSIRSLRSGSEVPTGGFIVSGTITDDTLGSTLNAILSGGSMAVPIKKEVEVAQATGRWSMVVAPEQVFDGSTLNLSLTARDAAGNERGLALALRPSDLFGQTWHIVQRTSFGANVRTYEQAVQTGGSRFVQQQLSPESVDDEMLAERAARWPSEGTALATAFVRHSAYSDRQLQSVMAWFWDNHFNTNFYTHGNSEFEKREIDIFRTQALGSFRVLLGESARSPAMLYTLDGRLNMKGRPNENYARELMELHTLGVSGGYTQRDVEEVARAFTGWTAKNGEFEFNAATHDTMAKTMLGRTIPAGGAQSDGETVLDMLAAHPSTAKFVCSKLVTVFVSDTPAESLVARCATTFSVHQSSPDQIRQVLGTILSSSEFLGTANRGNKLKTPLKFVVGAVRQIHGEDGGDDLSLEIQRQGMPLFMNPSPKGFSELGRSWLNSNMLHTRARFIDRLLTYTPKDSQTRFSIAEDLRAEGFETAEGVAGRMLEMMFGPTFARRHYELAIKILTEDGSYPYFPDSSDAEARVRRLGKALSLLPEYQYQ